jgi:hypothetical protein
MKNNDLNAVNATDIHIGELCDQLERLKAAIRVANSFDYHVVLSQLRRASSGTNEDHTRNLIDNVIASMESHNVQRPD